jgi:hypothetical protein
MFNHNRVKIKRNKRVLVRSFPTESPCLVTRRPLAHYTSSPCRAPLTEGTPRGESLASRDVLLEGPEHMAVWRRYREGGGAAGRPGDCYLTVRTLNANLINVFTRESWRTATNKLWITPTYHKNQVLRTKGCDVTHLYVVCDHDVQYDKRRKYQWGTQEGGKAQADVQALSTQSTWVKLLSV